ncbi:hypothetical protein GCM10009060_08420 [Halorubrum trapanicum]
MCVVEIRASFVVIDRDDGTRPQKGGGSGGIGAIEGAIPSVTEPNESGGAGRDGV